MKKKHILYAVTALATAGAIWLVYRSLGRYSLAEIRSSIGDIPAINLGMAAFFAACSYLCLTFFDYLGLRYCGKPLAWRKAAAASFTSLSIGHNVGVAALSSGAIRYRFYSRWGYSNEDVAKVILFCGITVGAGLITLAGLCLAVDPESAIRVLPVSATMARAAGLVLLSAIAVYIVLSARVRSAVRIRKWSFSLPELPLALAQIGVGTLNFAFVAACLHALLHEAESSYFNTVSAYVVGNIAAIVSHVPGGLGVLEATINIATGGAATIAALIMFRVIYFFIPLVGGVIGLLLGEWLIDAKRDTGSAAA